MRKYPEEIYLLQKGSQLLGAWSRTPQVESSGGWYSAEHRYIRADLAELTCDDIEKIDGLIREVGQKTDIKTYQETYQEVLRRFLESKKEI